MKKCSFKRLGALAMALIMCFALAVSASAVSVNDIPADGEAVVYKDGKTTTSMANDAFGGTYSATVNDDGTVTVDLPIQRIKVGVIYGYILESSVVTLNGDAVEMSIDADSTYTDATMTLTLPASAFFTYDDDGNIAALVSTILLDISFDLNLSTGSHSDQTSMSTDADLVLYVNPNTAD